MAYNVEGSSYFYGIVEPFASDHMITDMGTVARDGLVADSYGNMVLHRGTIMARITDATRPTYNKLVAKLASATYGPGSDVAVGILRNTIELTMGEHNASIVTHGKVRKAYVIDEGTRGAKADTLASLQNIEWV